MSTKITSARGENFHLYSEAFDEDYIYLQLTGVKFEATPETVTVPIPLDVWEKIRTIPGIEFDLVDHSDEDLARLVAYNVDDRRAHYKKSLAEAEKTGTVSLFAEIVGSLIYGQVDAPREDQIAGGIKYYRKRREYQQAVKNRMKEHRIYEP
jgi:hypothetical protein